MIGSRGVTSRTVPVRYQCSTVMGYHCFAGTYVYLSYKKERNGQAHIHTFNRSAVIRIAYVVG